MNEAEPPRTKSLLEDFSEIRDSRQPCKVMYRLSEVLLLVVCGTMAACDDYDDIVLWGKKHLNFLRGLQEYHHGIPCADWLRVVMNRIDPELFASCFLNFAGERLPGAVGQAALHLVSAYATTHSLVLGQRAVADKSNEITAIPLLLDELAASGALTGSLVSIDAMGCQSGIAEKPVRHRGEDCRSGWGLPSGNQELVLAKAGDNQKTAATLSHSGSIG